MKVKAYQDPLYTTRKIKKKLLITDKQTLPNGHFVYSGSSLGTFGTTSSVGFIDSKERSLFSFASPPQNIIQINTLTINKNFPTDTKDEKDNEDEHESQTPKRIDELRVGIGKDFLVGAIGLGVTDVLQKGGADIIAPYVANELSVGSNPDAVQAVKKILANNELSNNADSLGNIFKILIFLFTLFGISIKLMEIFFGNNVPVWAWVTSSIINFTAAGFFGMYLYDYGPFAITQ